MATPIVKQLEINRRRLEPMLADCMDIVQQELMLGDTKALLIYGETTVSNLLLDQSAAAEILKRLQQTEPKERIRLLRENGLGLPKSSQFTDLEEAISAMLTGDILLLVDGLDRGITLADKGYPGKGVGNCEAEKVLRGSSEGFCDSVKTNEALVRKRIRSTGLKILEKTSGIRSDTTVALLYMEELVQPEFLSELNDRLERYILDGVFDSGTLEQLMERDWASPFPQFQTTQRPDRVALDLLEGRVALLCDNSPTALLLPAGFDDFFRVSEDRYNHFELVTFQRIVRYGAMAAALYISAFYLAVINFHTQLLPTALLLSLAEARQGVPFPPLVEVLLMELSFEMIREAGVRMPGPLSGTIGIVGGLIIGDAAVSANLVSPMSVVVVAFNALCTFAVPDEEFSGSLRIVKLGMVLLGGFLGMGGILGGSFWLLLHLCGLESFGIPYMQIPHRSSRWEENRIFRQPAHRLRHRPCYVPREQSVRLREKGEQEKGENHGTKK